MICKLCGASRKLVDAHVIPRSFHRIDPAAKLPCLFLTNADGRYAQKVPKGVYDDNIVCEECERRFSAWDKYGDQLFIKNWHSVLKVPGGGGNLHYQFNSFDYHLLKMFLLSVLWRAAVSQHAMFNKVMLGPREVPLRESVLKSDPGDLNHFGVVLQAFDTTEVGILDPHLERFSGVRFCRLYLAHIIAFIKVDSRPFDGLFGKFAVSPERPLTILQKNYMRSPERGIMRSMVLADGSRGRTTG